MLRPAIAFRRNIETETIVTAATASGGIEIAMVVTIIEGIRTRDGDVTETGIARIGIDVTVTMIPIGAIEAMTTAAMATTVDTTINTR